MNSSKTLALEVLEERMMLSTVQIYAAGATGQEILNLNVDGQVVAEFTNVGGDASAREFVVLEYQSDQTINGGQVSLEFTNDFYDASTGFDRDLLVDRIVIDGVTHQAEGPSVFHSGLFRNGGTTGPGFLNSETLNINGFLSFSDANTPRDPTDERQVTFVARGTTGDEIVSLRIDGVQVKSFQLSQINQQYEFKTDQIFTSDQVQFSFDNDFYDPENGVDRNVVLEFLEIENRATNQVTRFTGESPDVFSTGTFRSEDGITEGFGRGDTLHSNGFFQFGSEPTSSSGTLITFAGGGTTGDEVVQVLVNDEVVFESVVAPAFNFTSNVIRSEYQVVVDQEVDLTDIKLAFVNDGVSGTRDRDYSLDYIYVRNLDTGEVQRTTGADDSTFSTGTFVGQTVESGFGRGNTLQINGFFQFANSSRLIVNASGTTGEERFQVIVKDQVLGEFGVSEAVPVEWETSFRPGFIVDVPEAVSIEDVRIQFINDGFDANGVDRNLTVSRVRLDGRFYDTDSAFSTGTFVNADGIVPGTGRGSTLHANGYFQFGVVSDGGSVGLIPDRPSGTPEVRAAWLPAANTSPNPRAPFNIAREESGDIIVRLLRDSGLDAASVTYQVVPSTSFGGPVPSSVSQDPITVVFEDGQIAANLVISVEDNNVPDNGLFFEVIRTELSDNLSGAFGGFDLRLSDLD